MRTAHHIPKQPTRCRARPVLPVQAGNANAVRPATLDRLADVLLQRGYHHAAERLSWQAAVLRGAAQ